MPELVGHFLLTRCPCSYIYGTTERNKISNYQGLWFYYDNDISIYWNRSHTFNVYSDGNEVDCFTVNETMTPKDAEFQADEWLEEQLEEEKREHAPAY